MKCTLKSQQIDFAFIFLISCFNSYEKHILSKIIYDQITPVIYTR